MIGRDTETAYQSYSAIEDTTPQTKINRWLGKKKRTQQG